MAFISTLQSHALKAIYLKSTDDVLDLVFNGEPLVDESTPSNVFTYTTYSLSYDLSVPEKLQPKKGRAWFEENGK